jgi:cell division protein YceG involved in septum cleavage
VKKIALFFLVVLLAAGVAAYGLYARVHAPYQGFASSEQFVEIPAGVGTRAIGDRLVASGVVRDRVTFRAALLLSG